MNILVGEVLQAWDQLSDNFLSVAGAKSKMKVVLDFAHITPKIIGKSVDFGAFFEIMGCYSIG